MQFGMKQLISPQDSSISNSAQLPQTTGLPRDCLLVTNVQIRRIYHIYADMARALDSDGETSHDKGPKMLALSILTRTANRELDNIAIAWRKENKAVSATRRLDAKVSTWVNAMKLRVS